jgi:tetratricopeptide (TPR) repeat protein
LIDALNKFNDAAVVGPQGSFFSFDLLKDYIYFDKGTFQKPIVVDAVSGFLFAVRTSLFNNFLLKFENDFTPCYFEEWDLGLQVKELGLKSYGIPSTDYIHHWSGSIKAYRKIKFYDQELTAKEIYDKNKEIFKRKWENKIKTNNKLQTGFIDFINNEFENTIDHNLERAIELLEIGLNYFPQEESFLINFAVALYTMGKKDDSIGVLKKVLEINPNNEIAKENLVILGQ